MQRSVAFSSRPRLRGGGSCRADPLDDVARGIAQSTYQGLFRPSTATSSTDRTVNLVASAARRVPTLPATLLRNVAARSGRVCTIARSSCRASVAATTFPPRETRSTAAPLGEREPGDGVTQRRQSDVDAERTQHLVVGDDRLGIGDRRDPAHVALYEGGIAGVGFSKVLSQNERALFGWWMGDDGAGR